jgi:hypothetical protein
MGMIRYKYAGEKERRGRSKGARRAAGGMRKTGANEARAEPRGRYGRNDTGGQEGEGGREVKLSRNEVGVIAVVPGNRARAADRAREGEGKLAGGFHCLARRLAHDHRR